MRTNLSKAEAIALYGSVTKLARAIGRTHSAVSMWNDDAPTVRDSEGKNSLSFKQMQKRKEALETKITLLNKRSCAAGAGRAAKRHGRAVEGLAGWRAAARGDQAGRARLAGRGCVAGRP